MAKVSKTQMPILSRFVQTRFGVTAGKSVSCAQLKVLKQGYSCIGVNRDMMGGPLMIGDRQFARGLGVHAVSEIEVTLPSPGKAFKAYIGRNQNGITRGNKGNVCFSVLAGEKELYKSQVFHGGESPKAINVPLKGAKKFTLRVGDVFDWGHADWADAYVVLEDGEKIWLDQIALAGVDVAEGDAPAFSFVYGGQSSADLLRDWPCSVKTRKLDEARTLRTMEYTDPRTGLQVTCEATLYSDFAAVEWVLWFRNTGKKDTPILENVQALDMNLTRASATGEFVLHHAVGSVCASKDFQPLETKLASKASVTLTPEGGRSSSGTLPFFNIEAPGGGVIGAVGWSGQWSAAFTRDEGSNLSVKAGMELTHLVLHPGEYIRTPRMLLVFWKGEYLSAQNMFRRFVLRHASPTPNGKLIRMPISLGHWGMTPENEHVNRAGGKGKAKIPFDNYWIDAGWYGDCDHISDWYAKAGSWFPNKKLYPNGFKPVSEAAHKNGMKFLLWFDPERVYEGSQIDTEHPEWCIGRGAPWRTYGWEGRMANTLFNMGIPEARRWLTDLISKALAEGNVDIFREDFNIDPLEFWRKNDAPDRQGYTEAKYIEGFYDFWDDLLKRHPGLAIDNCASGGRRIDLETIRRSVALWRSDLQCSEDYNTLGSQCQTYGLSYWLPLQSTGCREVGSTYDFRSAISSGISVSWPLEGEGFPVAWGKKMIEQAVVLRDFFYGDFYPLTSYSLSNEVWLAYQLDRPDLNAGAIIAFRREKCPYPSACLKLSGLNPKARYELKNIDTNKSRKVTGEELVSEGLVMSVDNPAECVILLYKKVK